MRKLFAILLFVLALSGCGLQTAHKQFYVASTSMGYVVALDGEGGCAYISRFYNNPNDAQKLAEQLNRDMGDNWPH